MLLIFRLSTFWPLSGRTDLTYPPKMWTFPYQSARFRIASSNPLNFWAENIFLTQLFDQFQVACFPGHFFPFALFFCSFLVFGRFQAERTSHVVYNVDVSVPKRPFSHRLAQSPQFLSRNHFLNPTFGAIPSCLFPCHVFHTTSAALAKK